jgi:DNA-binding response OmpR family regulator
MHRLVFIHPDQKLLSIYKKSLSEHFQIDPASDGLQGLRLIQKRRPDIIVSEYNLPTLSGASLLRFVRNHHELFAVPFIFLSTYHPAAETLGLGANEWMVASQVDPEILISKCHQHLKLKTINYV